MKRRDFIAALGSAAVAWPMGLHAQQMPVIGFLNSRSFDKNGPLAGAFRRGLAENGYVEGRNIVIEYRSADGDYARLSALAAELARLPVDVLVSVGGEPSAVAARAATSKIPTVSTIGTDPVRLGLAASDNRPGGNTTGVNIQTGLAEAKRIGLLRELVPQAATIGVLLNPSNQQLPEQTKDIEQASQAMKLPVRVLRAATEGEINTAFDTITQQRISALVVGSDPFFTEHGKQIVALAARHAVPAILSIPRICPGWRARELRYPADRRLSSKWRVCRADPKGRSAWRIAICADRPLRVGHKLENRQGARPCPLQFDAVARRRGDRITIRYCCGAYGSDWPEADFSTRSIDVRFEG
jgi:putative ABC transport system substrate-binding protein